MEKRLLIAIVISFLILFLYQAIFVKQGPQTETPQKTITQKEPEVIETPPEKEKSLQIKPVQKQDIRPVSGEREKEVIIQTSLYTSVWSTKGAVLKKWTLMEYKNELGSQVELISDKAKEINRYPFSLKTEDSAFDDLINRALFKTSTTQVRLANGESQELRLTFADEQGNKVEKILTFHDGSYLIDIQINLWKNNQKIEPDLVWGPSFGNLTTQAKQKRFGQQKGVAVYAGGKVNRNQEEKFDEEKSTYNFVQWAGYDSQYFTSIFITNPQKTSAAFIKQEVNENPYFFLTADHVQKAYIGPKRYDILSELGHDSKKLIKFGLFGFISEILYKAIKIVHQAVPNWGFSIIILTLVIKILFFPLTYSSTKSMAKMQELQPKIKAIRSKYKKAKKDIDQRRKLNEETMKLYKEHGVNPAGGCLPILIQLPIFWGFFRLLVVAIEFRHSPFIFWIQDLSVKDPYYITPILMGITQFISQKMTPTAGDPTQKKMMLIMPVIMTIFFMNFQSGLVLYWLTNNILQIGQQYITNRLTKKKESDGKRRKK
ncbi:MAG: membrane protein insertase YidC [Candidatus Aminicenantes bacterium]|nr:membrane protein insertase YidC [Candidatus Aminicenantes bacterium]